MRKYHASNSYQYIYKGVALVNVSLQVILLYILTTLNISFLWLIPVFFIAYFVTDLINGLVHLYMDHNESYDSPMGVFIASFHLHHKTPEYKKSNIFAIYFNESGPKFWLVPYLLLVLSLYFIHVNDIVLAIFILVGVLSSVAEVSHYLCHNSKSRVVLFLQKAGLLLSMKHHKKHHNEDNNGYAFLNGMSDIIIDIIAKKFYSGYKKNSDTHFENYSGKDTSNRT